MALTRHQRRVAYHILSVGRRKGASYKELVAAIATAFGEANLGNPWGGSGTSVGWRQEISSYGSAGRRHNVRVVANDFFNETRGKRGSAASIAFAVQRPAQPSNYYQQFVGQAKAVVDAFLHGHLGAVAGGGRPGTRGGTFKTVTPISAPRIQAGRPVVDDTGALVDSLIAGGTGHRHGSLIQDTLRRIDSGAYTTTTAPQAIPGKVKVGHVRVAGTPGSPAVGGGTGFPHGVGPHATPNLLIHIGHLAQKLGLRVSENPNFGGVGGGHVPGSYHYKNEAIDISGNPRTMAKLARLVQQRYGRHLAELIHNSPFGAYAIKNGRRVSSSTFSAVWAGHRDHVHIAVGRGDHGRV